MVAVSARAARTISPDVLAGCFVTRINPPSAESAAASELGSLEELYAIHVGPAVRLALLLCGNRELAEDIVQDAFVKVGGRLRQIREPAAFGAYLRQAVVNLTRSHFRHQAVARRHLERERNLPEPAADDPTDFETREALHTALQQLPERQREALVCRFYLDYSERQTAHLLDCPAGTVKSLVSRGLANLRQILGPETAAAVAASAAASSVATRPAGEVGP